jgi:hypothetical protein
MKIQALSQQSRHSIGTRPACAGGRLAPSARHHRVVDILLRGGMNPHQGFERFDHALGVADQIAVDLLGRRILGELGEPAFLAYRLVSARWRNARRRYLSEINSREPLGPRSSEQVSVLVVCRIRDSRSIFLVGALLKYVIITYQYVYGISSVK